MLRAARMAQVLLNDPNRE
nr:hypothetical protein [Rahnella bruchi]